MSKKKWKFLACRINEDLELRGGCETWYHPVSADPIEKKVGWNWLKSNIVMDCDEDSFKTKGCPYGRIINAVHQLPVSERQNDDSWHADADQGFAYKSLPFQKFFLNVRLLPRVWNYILYRKNTQNLNSKSWENWLHCSGEEMKKAFVFVFVFVLVGVNARDMEIFCCGRCFEDERYLVWPTWYLELTNTEFTSDGSA